GRSRLSLRLRWPEKTPCSVCSVSHPTRPCLLLPQRAAGRPMMRDGVVFPWRGDNRFELLIDGPRFFPRMLDAIASAQWQVELELYLIEDGECFGRLREVLVAA